MESLVNDNLTQERTRMRINYNKVKISSKSKAGDWVYLRIKGEEAVCVLILMDHSGIVNK